MSNDTVVHKSELSLQQLSGLRKDIQALIQQLREDLDAECYQRRAQLELVSNDQETGLNKLAAGNKQCSEGLGHIYQLEQEIRQAEQALQRLDSGRYGECASCHEAIELNRLTANPVVVFCLSCQAGGDT